MTTGLDFIAARVTDDDRAAIERCTLMRGGRKVLRKTAPKWRDDPKAWAAWQGLQTACGRHGEYATFTLLMLEDDARQVWDRVSDAAAALQREIRLRAEAKI